MKLYAVFDVKAQLPVVVFQSNTDVEAERRFLSLLTTAESTVFTANPGDFALVSFGDFVYDPDRMCLTIDHHLGNTIKSGNEYGKSYLDETRVFKLEYDKTVQTYIDAQVDFKYHEMLSNAGNLIADIKEDLKYE